MSLMNPEEGICGHAIENSLCQASNVEGDSDPLSKIPLLRSDNSFYIEKIRTSPTRTDFVINCGRICIIRRVVYHEEGDPEMFKSDPLSPYAVDGNCTGDPTQLMNLL